jgi:LPXTG-motif cell wall-anchored protein
VDPVTDTSAAPAGGALAWTGADLAPWVAASVALLLAGAGLVVARRRASRAAGAEDAR